MRRSVYEQIERDLTAARQAALEAERKDRELARLRCEHAAIRVSAALIRLQRVLARKYRPDQPRVPAGEPGAGEWTDEGGRHRGPLYASQQPRGGGGATRRIDGRPTTVTPAQAARLDVSEAQARVLTREVQRHDPSWRPQPSIYEGVEGRIQANQAEAQQAAARLEQLGVRAPEARRQEEALRPGGRLIGWREGGAGDDIRTCGPKTFRTLLESVSPGAQEVPSPPRFKGVWYEQPNGSRFALRMSERYGMTYEVIRNDHPIFGPGFKVHQK